MKRKKKKKKMMMTKMNMESKDFLKTNYPCYFKHYLVVRILLKPSIPRNDFGFLVTPRNGLS